MSLRTELVAVRTALATATSVSAYLRNELPVDGTGDYQFPTSASFVVLDLIGTVPTTTLDGALHEDATIQVSCWSRTGVTTALDLAEKARAALTLWDRTGPVVLARDGDYRGAQFRMTRVASFDTIE